MSVEQSPDATASGQGNEDVILPTRSFTRLSKAPVPDLHELREWHVTLLKRWDGKTPVRDAGEAQILRLSVQSAGAWIESPADRDGAQGIIDYWTSAVASLPGDEFPDLLQLHRFQPENRERWVGRADATFDSLKAEGFDEAARVVILDLLPERTSLLDRELKILSRPEAGDVRSRLAQAGLLGRSVRIDALDGWLVHEDLLRTWPQLTVWLTSLASQFAKFNKAMAELQNWQFRDRKAAYLLRGQALRDARTFRGRDQALDTYLSHSDRAHRLSIAGLLLLAALVLACGYGAYKWGDVAGYDYGFGKGKTKGAEVTEAEIRDQIVDPQPVQDPLAAGPALPENPTPADGFIWAGSSSTPLLRDDKGSPVDPATVTKGGRYHTRIDIMMRSELPDQDTYRSKPSVGILPAGALVEVLERPATFTRDSGTQYWIRIHRVTTVFVQYEGGLIEAAKARTLIAALTAQGYNVGKSPDHQPSAGKSYQVRFSYAEDFDQAQRLADTLMKFAPPGTGLRPRCFLMRTAKKNASGVLEVWIDLRAADVPATPSSAPGQRTACERPRSADEISASTTAN